jgi:cation diffusion facilitator family transporter
MCAQTLHSHIQDERIRAIRRASLISLGGNAVLAAAKIAAGIFSGSLAVVGDGIDSSTDIVISFISLIVAGYMAKPSDKEHPFGHGRAETLATSVLGFIIFFAGTQLLIQAGRSLAGASARELPSPAALYVTVFSIVGKLLLAFSQLSAGKKHSSELLIANGKNMQGDVLISGAILAGLVCVFVLGLPILDPIVAFLVGLWILKSGIDIFRKVNVELMDGNTDPRLYRNIFDAVRSVPGAGNPHRARIRKIASLYDIDLDIEVSRNLRIAEAHSIAGKVEKAIRERIDNVYDIMVHVEPEGNTEENESYGLSENEMREGP